MKPSQPTPSLDRRGFLGAALGAIAGLSIPASVASDAAANSPPVPSGGAGFRFVHLTDIHVQPERAADKGLAACLKAIHGLDPLPDFIFTGGDLIMDAFEQNRDRSTMLYDLLAKVLGDHTDLPIRHCMGNHDVFGWGPKSGVAKDAPGYGKAMFCERMGLERPYHAFDHKGVRFYSLDTIQPNGGGYVGGLGEEQWAWLEADLAAKPADTPGNVVSHIPFLTVTALKPPETPTGNWIAGASGMCADGRRAADLFAAKNVKLALSGHIHRLDRIDFRGTSFVCDGAVSGGWWKGPNDDVQEGFGLIDVAADGSFTHRYVDYGWEAVS